MKRAAERCEGGCARIPPFAYEVIEALPSHMAWVYKSWLESYHSNGVDLRGARFSTYSASMTARMQRLVQRSTVYVAVEPDDHDHLLAFAIVEAATIPIVHFAYVKGSRRERGLAARLLEHAFVRVAGVARPSEWHFSHATHHGRRAATREGHGGRYNASAAWDETRRAG